MLDFADNPDGIRRLGEQALGLGARGLLVMLGQAGDRTDPSGRRDGVGRHSDR